MEHYGVDECCENRDMVSYVAELNASAMEALNRFNNASDVADDVD